VLFVFTGTSAAANYWHGMKAGGRETKLYLGGMSVAVAVAFALALRQIRHEDRRRAGTETGRLPRFSVAHWLRHPRLTWRAWSLAVCDGHTSPRAAMAAALGQQGKRPSVASDNRPALPPGATATARQGSASGASRKRRAAASRRAAGPHIEPSALAVLARQPGVSGAELGRAIGASPRTGQRLLARLGEGDTETL
jgi:hypothetical protein